MRIFLLVVVLSFFLPQGIFAQQSLPKINPPALPSLLAPGLVSTLMGEYSPALDITRNELYFMRRTPGVFDYTIYHSRFAENGWTSPEITPFSGQHRDDAPYLTPTGDQLFFDSKRPTTDLGEQTINLWRTHRQEDGWSEPELLRAASDNPPPLTGDMADEFGPAIDGTGALYFYSFRTPFRGGARYTAQPDTYDEISQDRSLPDPSAQTFVSYLYLSPDSKTAILEGQQQDKRERDLFYACKTEKNTWTEAKLLPLVNTPAMESGGKLTADGSIMIFSSDRKNKNAATADSNLYWLSTNQLPIPCK
ncbi:MAG: hypothetical protein AB8G77_16285 [Rhodothermales bacterium]